MSRRRFSQAEALALQKQVVDLLNAEEQRRNYWASEWPLGTHIGSEQFVADSALVGAIITARKLKHAVIVTCKESGVVEFIALPLASEKREKRTS